LNTMMMNFLSICLIHGLCLSGGFWGILHKTFHLLVSVWTVCGVWCNFMSDLYEKHIDHVAFMGHPQWDACKELLPALVSCTRSMLKNILYY